MRALSFAKMEESGCNGASPLACELRFVSAPGAINDDNQCHFPCVRSGDRAIASVCASCLECARRSEWRATRYCESRRADRLYGSMGLGRNGRLEMAYGDAGERRLHRRSAE